MSHKTAATVAHTTGIDTGKNTLHLIGLRVRSKHTSPPDYFNVHSSREGVVRPSSRGLPLGPQAD